MTVEELFKQGFLKSVPPSKERARKSLAMAEKYLSEAKKALSAGSTLSVILCAYSSVFHAARAILFVDGVSERSHFAIYDYLKEKHKGFGVEEINSFNLHRRLRHSVAYGLDTVVGKEDAEESVRFAEDFVPKVKKYLKL